ncbi:hypothetical protein V8E51_018249 [Hyaloscypha variabilis]
MYRFVSIDDCKARYLNGTTPNPNPGPLIISYSQCLHVCGTGWGTYPIWEVVSALTDWVIPLFLLLGNITYSKSASQVFKIGNFNCGAWLNWVAVISHLLVNPLDFLWNLALKLDSGREIRERVDRIEIMRPEISMTDKEKKYLCGICYALEDFESGIHVETLLRPLEEGSHFQASLHREAMRPLLETTARNIAGDRRHNKFHSILAITVYGKDVFVALLQSKFDATFPYHMPHTLALRQLYYWLFCAIILSGAAGGFADQWSSHAFLNTFLAGRWKNLKRAAMRKAFRYEEIVLRPIEPWNGGDYSWKYPKRGQKLRMTRRQKLLLLPAIAAVALPVVIAFIMSWFTPTIGLGDRGIGELSFAGMWILNFFITLFASSIWREDKLFKIYIWNTFWSIGSLYILFGAFQGWYNNCASWSGFYSRGAAAAYIDLNMRTTIQNHIFTFYLPITAASLVIQLCIAGLVIWINWEVIEFTIWSDKENREFFERHRGEEAMVVEMVPMASQEEQLKVGLMVSERELPGVESEEWSVSFEDQE